MSTRVCVKQLPSHATEDKLRELFADVGRVTDCRLMKRKDGRSRRFAFVGFATPEDAVSALSLDKVFLGTTRIRVEAAFEYKAPTAPRPWSRHTAGSSAHDREHGEASHGVAEEAPGRKGRAAGEQRHNGDATDAGKLDEFRAAMRNRNASATWANDDTTTSRRNRAPASAVKAPGAGAVSDSDEPEDDSDGSDTDEPIATVATTARDGDAHDSSGEHSSDEDDDEMAALMRQAEGAAQGHSASAQALAFLQSKQSGAAADGGDDADDDDADDDDASSQDSALDILDGQVQPSKYPTKARAGVNDDDDDDLADLRMDDGESDQEDSDEDGGQKSSSAAALSAGGDVLAAGRLFVRNLPFTATDSDLRSHFSKWGTVTEAHVSCDATGRSKGFGFIAYEQDACAAAALAEADLKMFQGRLIHLLPGKAARGGSGSADGDQGPLAPGQSAFQAEQEAKRKAAAVSGEEEGAWNALFVRADAAVKAAAAGAGKSVTEVMDPSADNLAVRVALGETAVIDQTKAFLKAQGVDLDAVQKALGGKKLRASQRSDTTILVKNLPHTTAQAALRGLFGRYGPLLRLVLPPARVLALVEFERPVDAKRAFKGLAYKRFESVPLYLEWAPDKSFADEAPKLAPMAEPAPKPAPKAPEAAAPLTGRSAFVPTASVAGAEAAPAAEEHEEQEEAEESSKVATVFVKGLSFGTTEDGLLELFSEVGAVRTVRIPRKQAASSSGAPSKSPAKSMGYGFVEYDGAEMAIKAVKRLQGAVLDGRSLALSLSHRAGGAAAAGSKSAVQRKGEAGSSATPTKAASKLLGKNLAFEATRNDLRQLFGAFGKLKSVRVPRKPDGSGRGFGFVEFASAADARMAVQSLGASHLYGRHIVMQWAQNVSSMAAVQAKAKAAARKEASFAPAKRQRDAPSSTKSGGKKAKPAKAKRA
jgi:multiple RNA-binding domain-containing protein 1